MMNIQVTLKNLENLFLNFTNHRFTYGPQGQMLLRNIENHWYQHCVTMSPYNVFLTATGKLKNTLEVLKDRNMDNTPFGLVTIEDSKSLWNQLILPMEYKVTSHRIARMSTVIDNTKSKDLFHRKQRERKVWWRKLSQHPSRFILTEAKKIKNYDVIEIEAQFPFGNITIESIIYQHDVQKLFLQTDDSKLNNVDKHMIEHTASLDWGCFALLCDCYEFNELNKALIHPKLSPYKVAFHIEEEKDGTETDAEELNRLVLYLNNTLKVQGLQTILTNKIQVIEMCLVPFIVTVTKTSLKNGIIHITNRSTSLPEAIHVSDLVKYVASRCS